MTPGLRDLLFTIRQHPSFREFVDAIECPEARAYSPSKGAADAQSAEWIYRSGRKAQHELWRSFLTDNSASDGGKTNPSQQEIP